VNKARFPKQNWGKIRGICSASVLMSSAKRRPRLERMALTEIGALAANVHALGNPMFKWNNDAYSQKLSS
jgi:hypothetical protein